MGRPRRWKAAGGSGRARRALPSKRAGSRRCLVCLNCASRALAAVPSRAAHLGFCRRCRHRRLQTAVSPMGNSASKRLRRAAERNDVEEVLQVRLPVLLRSLRAAEGLV